jgi:deazaflavin-dependent oxidoreductase (nitroreductase family)
MKIRQRILNWMRLLNKYTLNRLTRRFAGASRSPFAVIRHVGRRSGKPYETPVIARPTDGSLVIPLAYGPDVDWYRNVLATGRCQVLWRGQAYTIEQLEPMDAREALSGFPLAPQRLILWLHGAQQFVRMKYRAGEPGPTAATA